MKDITKEERLEKYRNYLISAFDLSVGFNLSESGKVSEIDPIPFDFAERMLLNKLFRTGVCMVLSIIDNEAYDPENFSLDLEISHKNLMDEGNPVKGWYTMFGDMKKQWDVDFPPVHPVLLSWPLTCMCNEEIPNEKLRCAWNRNHVKMSPYTYWSWCVMKLEENLDGMYKIPEQLVREYIQRFKDKNLNIYYLSTSK